MYGCSLKLEKPGRIRDSRKFFSHRNSLDQETINASSVDAFRGRLNKLRQTRVGFAVLLSHEVTRGKIQGKMGRVTGPNTELSGITCHMGSHSTTCTCHPTQVNAFHLHPQPNRLVLDLPTPEGRKAEFTQVVGYILPVSQCNNYYITPPIIR